MKIEIENTSSPGASFTKNTNTVLLKTYEWICEHKGISLPFKEFRMKLQSEKGINDNNNRNIYPLLKNGGLVSYEKGGDIKVDYFYTNTGLAYVKTLETVDMIEKGDYSKQQIVEATRKFEVIQQEIIFGALTKIVNQPDVNYVEPFQDLIRFLLKFGKISKVEFAYLLYMKQQKEIREALNEMHPHVDMYRCGDLEIEVHVKVRNDIDLRKKNNSDKRKEDLTFLTSYGYFTSLLLQAGLIEKSDKYFEVVEEKRNLLGQLGGV
jgi:hypothetical protein